MTTTRTIRDIIKDIQNTNSILRKEIESVPYGQRPALQIAMIQASEKLPRLLSEIKQVVVPTRLVGLFASGDETSINKTAAFLVENEGIVLNANKIYQDIASRVEPSYSKDRLFCTTQYSLMVGAISDIGLELGYLEIESPKFKELVCKTFADTVTHIKNTLRECKVGDQANVDLLTNAVVDAIVKEEIDSKQIPVIVTGVTSIEERNAIATIFNKSIDFTFSPDFEPTAEKIVALFKSQSQSV
jgi:hypothetical protein